MTNKGAFSVNSSVRRFAWLPKEINGVRKWLRHYRVKSTPKGVLMRWESASERL